MNNTLLKLDGNESIFIFDDLKSIDIEFTELYLNQSNLSESFLFHKIIELTHKLNNLLLKAINFGITIDRIRGVIPNTLKYHRTSEFIKHIQDWPLGYQGDFKIVNMIIDRIDKYEDNLFSKYISHYSINSLIAQQHREKVIFQSKIVLNTCLNTNNAKIVSLACGSSRDLESIQNVIIDKSPNLLLCDFDENALEESKKRLNNINHLINYLKIDLRKINNELDRFVDINGKIDLVYAGGLFDYLNCKTIKFLMNKISSDYLKEDGTFFFTNIAKNNPYKNWIEVLGNWQLIERTYDDIEDICKSLNFKFYNITKDPTELTWLVTCKNKN